MAKIKLSDISTTNGTQSGPLEIPKYASQVINLANGYANATRPAHVGMVSQEIQNFRNDKSVADHTFESWKKWHQEKFPDGIKKATESCWDKFVEMRNKLCEVTKEDIEKWEKNLVFDKTYDGLMVQKAIIEHIAAEIGTKNYKLANAKEESQGIDGFINNKPIQVKSKTFQQSSKISNESTRCTTVEYEKRGKNIIFDYNPEDFQ